MNWDKIKVFANRVTCIEKETVENDSRRAEIVQYSLTITVGDGNSLVRTVCKNYVLKYVVYQLIFC